MNDSYPSSTPVSIKLHKNSRNLEIEFADGHQFILPFEYLRIYSPSAEVRGHGADERIWLFDKQQVNIKDITPVGHYAVRLHFDDGHDTGLYAWDYLYELGQHQQEYWRVYLSKRDEVDAK